jgi:mono/diheme cytochrome c family protein
LRKFGRKTRIAAIDRLGSGKMVRSIVAACSAILLSITTGSAETPLERGSYLVNSIMACGNCHTPKNSAGEPIADKELAGGATFTVPPFTATASNITPDPETGIGKWTDDEIKRAITEGVRPNHVRFPGVPLAAVMAVTFFKALLPSDLDAVVVYLRSVKPVRNTVPDPVYRAPVHHDSYPEAEAGFSTDVLRDPVRRGAYLVTIGHCMECHSTREKGVSDYVNGLGRGGRQFGPALVQGFPADWQGSTARNITSHKTAGIGAWTDAEIKRAIVQGIRRDGTKLKPPMSFASYAKMTDDDLNAIVAYLRTVPPKD